MRLYDKEWLEVRLQGGLRQCGEGPGNCEKCVSWKSDPQLRPPRLAKALQHRFCTSPGAAACSAPSAVDSSLMGGPQNKISRKQGFGHISSTSLASASLSCFPGFARRLHTFANSTARWQPQHRSASEEHHTPDFLTGPNKKCAQITHISRDVDREQKITQHKTSTGRPTLRDTVQPPLCRSQTHPNRLGDLLDARASSCHLLNSEKFLCGADHFRCEHAHKLSGY